MERVFVKKPLPEERESSSTHGSTARSSVTIASSPALGDPLLVICSSRYPLVEYVWDTVGLILFLGVYIELYIGDSLYIVL